MEATRIIISSNENGEAESVFFTTDFNSAASDLIPCGQTVDSDNTVTFEVPNGFPMEFPLTRG